MITSRSNPLVYVITNRRLLPPRTGHSLSALNEFIERAVAAEVDLLQIRERDLPARDLVALTDAAFKIANGSNTRILVNDRADLAGCAGVGVHLTTRSLTPEVVRRGFGSTLLIGVSTHSLDQAEAAERGGADFIVFGPVFETESKRVFGPPVGLEALSTVTTRLRIPVLALGGIKEASFRTALDAGAAGVAGISIFTEAGDLKQLVHTIKERP